MERQSAFVDKAPDAKPRGSCGFLPLMMMMMMLMSVLMCMPMIMFVPICMLMCMGFVLSLFFSHGMPIIMVTVVVIVIMVMVFTIISAELAFLGVVSNALVVAVRSFKILHGCGCSNCASVLPLYVEVSNQCLCFSAKDLLKVYSGLFAGEYLQENRSCLSKVTSTTSVCKGNVPC